MFPNVSESPEAQPYSFLIPSRYLRPFPYRLSQATANSTPSPLKVSNSFDELLEYIRASIPGYF